MIRLVIIGNQIHEDENEFAFFDMETYQFLSIFGQQVFSSKVEFREYCHASNSGISNSIYQRCIEQLNNSSIQS